MQCLNPITPQHYDPIISQSHNPMHQKGHVLRNGEISCMFILLWHSDEWTLYNKLKHPSTCNPLTSQPYTFIPSWLTNTSWSFAFPNPFCHQKICEEGYVCASYYLQHFFFATFNRSLQSYLYSIYPSNVVPSPWYLDESVLLAPHCNPQDCLHGEKFSRTVPLAVGKPLLFGLVWRLL